MRYDRAKVAALAAMTLLAAGCSQRGDAATLEESAPAASAPAQLTVTAADFHFQTARTTPAGITTIRLVNNGPDLHHAQLVRLSGGHTLAELLAEIVKNGEHLPAWATLVGGPNTPAPGGESQATLDLEAGEYAILCAIPAPDGVPHVMKGMVVPLTVTPSTSTAAEPIADVQMVLSDYAFHISPELAAGKHTIRVSNAASQPHEVFIAKLAPGKSAPDLLTWMQTHAGPPPAMPLGGTTFMATGESNYLTMDLTPGQYALYCFVSDAKDHQPHVAHGMMKQITVE